MLRSPTRYLEGPLRGPTYNQQPSPCQDQTTVVLWGLPRIWGRAKGGEEPRYDKGKIGRVVKRSCETLWSLVQEIRDGDPDFAGDDREGNGSLDGLDRGLVQHGISR